MIEFDYSFIAVCIMGATTQEVVHWYDLRGKFGQKRISKIIKSPSYWIVTLLMILCSGIGIWILFGEKDISRDLQFILGAAFPLIFKKMVVAFGEKDQTNLGKDTLSKYFELFSFSERQ